MIDSAAVKREFASLGNKKEEEEQDDNQTRIERDDALVDNNTKIIGSNEANFDQQDNKTIASGVSIDTGACSGELTSSSTKTTTTTTNTTNTDDSTTSGILINPTANSYEEKIVTKVDYDEENFIDNESSSNDYQSDYDAYSYAGCPTDRPSTNNLAGESTTHEQQHKPQNQKEFEHNQQDYTHNNHHRQNHNNFHDPHYQKPTHNNDNHHQHELHIDNQSDSTMTHSDEPEQMRKLFIGGLDYKTSEATLKKHFERFGDVLDCVVMREPQSKRSRGFGFVIYASSFMVDKAQKARPHQVDGREVQSKRAISREDSGKPEAQATVKKVYLGGLSDDIEKEELENYFKMFGNIVNINIVAHKDTGKRRGFAFVEYDDHDPVDKIVLKKFHTIKDKRIEAKKAIPKIEMDARKRGSGPGDPRAAMTGTMMALAAGSSLNSITGVPSSGRRPGPSGRPNGCASGAYLWGRLPYNPSDYPELEGYPSHYYHNAGNWMMDGGGPPAGGPSNSSYGPSSRGGPYGRNVYANHVQNWIAAADYAGAGNFQSSQGSGGVSGGGTTGAGPMRLSYQHNRFGPYTGGYGGSAHRGRHFNP